MSKVKNTKYLKVGISIIDISSAREIELCGYAARMGGNIGIHDNLYAKSITFDDGVNKGAIVACDLIGLDYEIISFARNEVGKRIGVNPESIMIASSHTHSGPATIQSNGIGLKDENYINY